MPCVSLAVRTATRDGVKSSFEMVGAKNNMMDFDGFHRWVDMMFGDFTEAEFEERHRNPTCTNNCWHSALMQI